jgi:hypothetical protein
MNVFINTNSKHANANPFLWKEGSGFSIFFLVQWPLSSDLFLAKFHQFLT